MQLLLNYIWIELPALAAVLFIFMLVRAAKAKIKKNAETRPTVFLPSAEICERAQKTLSDLIKFQTVAPSDGDYSPFQKQNTYIRKRFPKIFTSLSVQTVDGCGLLCRWPGSDETLHPVLLCSHLDVVPAGAGWEHKPFDGEVDDGYVYGRGAIDCKNGVTAILEAVNQLLDEGFVPRRDLYIAFGYDEETGGKLGAARMAEHFNNQGIHFDMVLDEGDFILKSSPWLSRPAAFIDVAEKGVVTLRLTAKSVPGHASRPPIHTAPGIIAEAITRIEAAPFKIRQTRVTKRFINALVPYMPFRDRFYAKNRWFFHRRLLKRLARDRYKNALLRTTAAVTVIRGGVTPNVLPASAEAIVNIRTIHGHTADEVIDFYRLLLSGLDLEVTVERESEPSMETDSDGYYFKAISRTIHEVFGEVPILPSLLPAGTDGRKYEIVADHVFRFFPAELSAADLATMHGPEERISVQNLGAAVQFFMLLIKNLQS